MNIQATEVTGVYPIAGGKGYNLQLNNGNKYTLWGDNMPSPCNKGDAISFEFTEKQNGAYTNRSITKAGITVEGGNTPSAVVPTASSVQAPRAQAKPDNVQSMIVAQNSLTNATNLVIAYKEELNVKGDNITNTVKEIASVLAKAVIAGDFYKDPSFDDDISVLTGGK